MAIGDVYELVDHQTFQGKEVLNVYYYRNVNLLDTADNLAQYYIDQVLPLMLPLQISDLVHTSVSARNLFNDADVAEIPISEAGTGATGEAEGMPAFNAYTFTLYGAGSTTRPGGKRVSGMWEGGNVDGAIVAGLVTALAALADGFVAALLDDADAMRFQPVIVKRILEIIDGEKRYRLPEVIGELVFQVIVDAAYSLLVSSQVSRKS